MKRASSSAELEPEAKRRRVDVEQRETLAEDSPMLDITEDVLPVTSSVDTNNIKDYNKDLVNNLPPIDPIITPDSMSAHNATTIGDLPLEVIGNHVFKFFDFEYWLEHFVTVCKSWQLAAEQATVDKQLRVRRVGTACCTIKRYKVSTLIIKFSAHLHDLVPLINASPRIHSVKFNRLEQYNWAFQLSLATKFTFNNVSTLFIPAEDLPVLRLFPNVSKVCISNHEFGGIEFISSSVLELALPESGAEQIIQLLRDVKTMFPSVHTTYFKINDGEIEGEQRTEEEIRTRLDNVAEEHGISLVYSCNLDSGAPSRLSGTSYDNYFSCVGNTLFCNSLDNVSALQEVFQQFPTLTLEYEQDFMTRKRNFAFPRVKSTWRGTSWSNFRWMHATKEVLAFCYGKNMLPTAGLVHYYIKQQNFKSASKAIKSSKVADEITAAVVYHSPSLVQLSEDIEAELFKKIVTRNVLWKWITENPFEDLTPIKNLIIESVKYSYSSLVNELNNAANDKQWQYLVLFDSWLHPKTSRRVADKPCIGIQYLSDEGQAEYVATAINYGVDHVIQFSERLSKPLNQIFHNGKSLVYYIDDKLKLVRELNLDVNQLYSNGLTPLVHAINEDNVHQVEDLLILGADPNFAGNTSLPLHHLLQKGAFSFSILSALVTFGADVNRQDYDSKGRTVWPITLALNHGYTTVKYLLQMGADPTVVDTAGNTLLHLLCRQEFMAATQAILDITKLLSTKIDINAKNNLGDTLLHRAITGSYMKEIVKMIIKCGADISIPDALGRTPLYLACLCNHDVGVLKAILGTNKVDIKARTKDGESVIYPIFDCMQHSLANYLKDKGLKAACQPYLTEDNWQFIKDECSTIMESFNVDEMVVGDITVAKYFVETLEFDVARRSSGLLQFLDPAKPEVLDYLLANGLDINARNKAKETALLGCMKERLNSAIMARKIQLLIGRGASVTEADKSGIAPIDIDPLVETRYSNGLHVDYFIAVSNKELPNIDFMELRKKDADKT